VHDAEELSRALAAPFRYHRWIQAAAFLSGLIVAPIVAQFATRDVAIAVGVAAMLAAVGGYWLWWIRSRYPPAAEAIADHNRLEGVEWRAATGAAIPCTRPQVVAWLAAHPETDDSQPRRIGMLQWAGDLVGAQREIGRLRPGTASETFAASIARGTQVHLEGGIPDLTPVREAFARLSDPRDQRHGRVCEAILEARLALARGADPYEPLLAARAEIGEVDPAVTTGLVGRRLALILAAAVIAFVIVALGVS
jgi:hypothetical protein